MRMGVLALQGGFAEHMEALGRLGVPAVEIRKTGDLADGLDGLILPGGESTVIGRLLRETGLHEPLNDLIKKGLPVFGTCAGMILLASKVDGDPTPTGFSAVDITVKRNAYGRQLGSFQTDGLFSGIGELPMTFIRAPYIADAGGDVRILASVDGKAVAAESGNILVTAFHPELTADLRIHRYFLNKIKVPSE